MVATPGINGKRLRLGRDRSPRQGIESWLLVSLVSHSEEDLKEALVVFV